MEECWEKARGGMSTNTNTHLLIQLANFLEGKTFSVTEWSTHLVVTPRDGLLANDSESLLRMNKTQEASSLGLGIGSSVFPFKYNLPWAIFSPPQEAGNGSSYVKLGRELQKTGWICLYRSGAR